SVAPVAARTRDQVALTLLGCGVRQRIGRAPHRVPQRVGQLAELVLDDDLLEHGQSRTTELNRCVDGLQAGLEDRGLDRGVRLAGYPIVALALVLERDDFLGERTRALLELGKARAVCEFHGVAVPF